MHGYVQLQQVRQGQQVRLVVMGLQGRQVQLAQRAQLGQQVWLQERRGQSAQRVPRVRLVLSG